MTSKLIINIVVEAFHNLFYKCDFILLIRSLIEKPRYHLLSVITYHLFNLTSQHDSSLFIELSVFYDLDFNPKFRSSSSISFLSSSSSLY